MSERFAERVVLVTGGATGIGAASARAFAREGARVTVVDVNDADGEATAGEIGGRFRHVDVRDEDAVRDAVEEAVRDFGRLDVLLANAGIEWTKRIVDTTLEEWERVIGVNLTGVYLCCRFALMQMVKQGSGAIVVTASPHALMTVPDAGAYAASKGGVNALTRALATELGVKLLACQMSMDVMEVQREDLIENVQDVVGVAAFLEEAAHSKITLFI